jgi:TolB-like protein/class 3 adenylate cyclase/Flp pilus assembly protein TadD
VSGERKLAAIMFTDIVGFSRQMGADEARMLRLLEVHNQLVSQAVGAHHGHVIKTIGDAFLVDFPSVVHAVQCAQHVQQQLRTHNMGKEKAEQIHVRIGIHLGDVVQKDGDVFGDGVNIASRLQSLAEPDTICISQKVYEEVVKKIDLGTVVSLGKPKLKNIAERFTVYALLPEAPKSLRQTLQVQRFKLSRRLRPVHGLSVAGLLLVVGTLITVRYLPFLVFNSTLSTPHSQLPLPDKPSIVVLPFANMSEDASQDYFSDGITEDITTDLSQLSSLFVISRNSAFTYKGKAVKLPEVSRELGVQYVLEGSVRRSENHVRITAQLIDATKDQHVWSERYDRPLQDIFAVQDEIRQQIVLALKVKLTPEEQARFKSAPTNNLEAYDFYVRGREYALRALQEKQPELNMQAKQLYENAIERDSSYAGAYAALGGCYFLDWFYLWNTNREQTLGRAAELAHKASTLDDSLSLPHWILSLTSLWSREHEQAIAEGERAVALDPNDADSYVVLGNVLVFAGRAPEGVEVILKAMRLNPHSPPRYLNLLGLAYRMAGRCEDAIVPLKKAVTLEQNFLPAHANLAACYAELDKLEEAGAEIAQVLRISPNTSLARQRQFMPFKTSADVERNLAALHKAGLK